MDRFKMRTAVDPVTPRTHRGVSWGGPQRRIAALLVTTLVATFGGSALTAGVAAAGGTPTAPSTTTTTSPGAPPPITPIWALPPTTTPTTPTTPTTTVPAPTTPTTAPPKPKYDPATDPNSIAATTAYMGAPSFWNAGFTGRGVDVAVIDSGVMPVAGLDGPDKIVYGPDLSFESQAPELRNLDTFGHGTFMAGLIAGHDSDLAAPYSTASASQYRGVAPDARILSVKVATADGGTDVSQVIAAVDWVVQHKNDNGMNIRVLNLSYAVNSTQDYLVDPLMFAVEQAWRAGIFVTTSAGNDGFVKKNKEAGPSADIGAPARDPNLVAVGASDSKGTATKSDDRVPSFSASGGFARSIDLVAPGTSLQGLRVPGSFVDTNFSHGALGDRYFRGSGTSQSAAILAGAAALVIQQRPGITPSQLKALFMKSTISLPGVKREWQGKGEIDLARAFATASTANATSYKWSTGTGSLELARGTDHVTDEGAPLVGEIDIFGQPFDAAAMAKLEAARKSWTGGTWNGTQWTGDTWTMNEPIGTSWTGRSWTGRSWTGRSWTGRSWTGRSWTGRSWTGGPWADTSISGRGWSGGAWAGGSWG